MRLLLFLNSFMERGLFVAGLSAVVAEVWPVVAELLPCIVEVWPVVDYLPPAIGPLSSFIGPLFSFIGPLSPSIGPLSSSIGPLSPFIGPNCEHTPTSKRTTTHPNNKTIQKKARVQIGLWLSFSFLQYAGVTVINYTVGSIDGNFLTVFE